MEFTENIRHLLTLYHTIDSLDGWKKEKHSDNGDIIEWGFILASCGVNDLSGWYV